MERSYECDVETIMLNRKKINYSSLEFERLFVDIFKGLGDKKIILFGSGKFAHIFINQFEKFYEPEFIVDNNETRWNKDLVGVPILSPEVLVKMDPQSYKVFICVKDYLSIVGQLEKMGIHNYSIFDPQIDYYRERRRKKTNHTEASSPRKKYGIGYIAGVFDLFHVGHLNLLRRAKEQCDYLIAGVVSDEGVRKYKKTEPFIPFEERLDIIGSCKFVDEAVRIPTNYNGTKEAFKMYKFDCQFSGSDYENDPNWLANRDFLRKHGAEMVFLPYTKKTSSTKLKSEIRKSLE